MKTRKAPELRRQSLDYDTNAAGDEDAIHCKDPSLAQQQFAEESDINFIADRYGLTGELPTVLKMPAYGDFTGIYDFQSANNAVIAARDQFLTLPAKLRARFDNDPQKLLAFLHDEENRPEAEFLGLVEPRKAPVKGLDSDTGELTPEATGDNPAPKAKSGGEPTPKTPRTPPKEAP